MNLHFIDTIDISPGNFIVASNCNIQSEILTRTLSILSLITFMLIEGINDRFANESIMLQFTAIQKGDTFT